MLRLASVAFSPQGARFCEIDWCMPTGVPIGGVCDEFGVGEPLACTTAFPKPLACTAVRPGPGPTLAESGTSPTLAEEWPGASAELRSRVPTTLAFWQILNSSTALLPIGEKGPVSRGFRGPFTARNRPRSESRQSVRAQFIRRKVWILNHTPLA